jgi:hypothetical protein
MKFVLIVAYIAANFQGAPAPRAVTFPSVSMQEFDSEAACKNAEQELRRLIDSLTLDVPMNLGSRAVRTACLPQG